MKEATPITMLTRILRSMSPDYWVDENIAVYSFNTEEDATLSTWRVEWLRDPDGVLAQQIGRVWLTSEGR